ncbi:TPA: hypothetical protein ACXK4S_000665 [Pseudomonas aeruginosa]
MKNAIYAPMFLLAFIASSAQAEYMIKIPLEIAQGGTLPNGSIIIGSKPINPSNPNPDEGFPDDGFPPEEEPLTESQCLSLSSQAASILSPYPSLVYKSASYTNNICSAEVDFVDCSASQFEVMDGMDSLRNAGFNEVNVTPQCQMELPDDSVYTSQPLHYVNSTNTDDYYQSADGSEYLSVQRTIGGDLQFQSMNYNKAAYNYLVLGNNECRFWETGGTIHAELIKCPQRIYDDASKPQTLTLTIKHYEQAQYDRDSYNENFPLDQRLIHPYTTTNPDTGEEETHYFYHQ